MQSLQVRLLEYVATQRLGMPIGTTLADGPRGNSDPAHVMLRDRLAETGRYLARLPNDQQVAVLKRWRLRFLEEVQRNVLDGYNREIPALMLAEMRVGKGSREGRAVRARIKSAEDRRDDLLDDLLDTRGDRRLSDMEPSYRLGMMALERMVGAAEAVASVPSASAEERAFAVDTVALLIRRVREVSADSLPAAQRRPLASALRSCGMSLREVGAALGVDKRQVQKDVAGTTARKAVSK